MKPLKISSALLDYVSHSARSAWIETVMHDCEAVPLNVALRKECVD